MSRDEELEMQCYVNGSYFDTKKHAALARADERERLCHRSQTKGEEHMIDTNTGKFFDGNKDPHIKNQLLLQGAMEAMYSTYITDNYIAEARGEAIRALDSFYLSMTGERLIPMFEGAKP